MGSRIFIRVGLLLMLIIVHHQFLYAQEFENKVKVVDGATGDGLEFATISSMESNNFVSTDENGEASIINFSKSSILVVRLVGYKNDTVPYKELVMKNFVIRLSPLDVELEKLSVYAEYATRVKPDENLKLVSITAEEIAHQNPQTTADLVASSGEVFVQKSQLGGGSPMIRGFSTNRILLTVDGVRMNNAIFRGGNVQNIISLDAFATERAEVILGPGSVVYGSDALGGVIGFKTLSPKFSTKNTKDYSGHYASRYSSANNEITNHLDFNISTKRWASLTSITYSDFGDLRMGSNGPEDYLRTFVVETNNGRDLNTKNDNNLIQRPTGYNQLNLMQKFSWKIGNHWKYKWGLHYSQSSNNPRYDRLIRTRNNEPVSAEWYYGPQKWSMNQFTVINSKSNVLFDQVEARLAFQQFEESRIDRDFEDVVIQNRVENVDAYSINIDFEKNWNNRHFIYYGFEGVLNDVQSDGFNENALTGARSNAQSRYPDASWNSTGVYLTYKRETKQSNLEAGIRYNAFAIDANFDTAQFSLPFSNAQLNNDAITGSIGYRYRVTNSTIGRITASTGFRSPNVDDMGKVFDIQESEIIVPNDELEAEYVYNIEIGVTQKIGSVDVNLSGYYTYLDDALVRRPFQLNGADSILFNGNQSQVFAIQNAAEATVYGLHAGFKYKKGSWQFKSLFNYQRGEEELDDGTISASRHVAPWFGSTHLLYERKKVLYDFYAIYNGEISFDNLAEEERLKPYLYALDSNGNPYAPGWYTLNFKMTLNVVEFLDIGVGLENILDKRYRTYSSGITAAGRNLVLSARAQF